LTRVWGVGASAGQDLRDGPSDGVWVTRYGYLSDERLGVLGDMWGPEGRTCLHQGGLRMQRRNATNERYWAEYDGLQHAKHQLLRRYLGGWFPILARWNRRVLYVDCHAGRGRHKKGQVGSPILALQILLEHQQCRRMLASTEVCFAFFEIDRGNYDHLCLEVDSLGKLPDSIKVDAFYGDYEAEIRKIVKGLKQQKEQLAPAFAFLDPYSFRLPMDLLNELLDFPQCELLVNFMYRYVDMVMHKPAEAYNLDGVFGCTHWRQLCDIKDPKRRAEETIALLSHHLQAEYVTHMYMKAANGTLKYVLLHATNHRKGRELMKEAMWSITPDGSFAAFERDCPDQLVLIVPDPDLGPLKDHLWDRFVGKQVRMDKLYDWLLGELYLKKHLHKVLRGWRNRGLVEYTGSFSKNPSLLFSRKRSPAS